VVLAGEAMGDLRSVIVFFDCERLPRERLYDIDARGAILRSGVQALLESVPSVTIGVQIPSSCAVHVLANTATIREIGEFLRKSKLGSYQFNDALFKAAKG
jgi:hypothetical protein